MSDAYWHELASSCSNAGRWGAGDERGTLNLIGAREVLEALGTVTAGELVSLAYELPVWDDGEDCASLEVAHTPGRGSSDRFSVAPHGYLVTHVDALGHFFHSGLAYNGRNEGDVVGEQGLSFGSITAMSPGIMTRGVLLDVAAARGVTLLEQGEGISRADVVEAERRSGTSVRRGDAVFIRSGIGQDRRWLDRNRLSGRPGVLPDVIPWLHEKGVAVYSGDCIERLDESGDRRGMPLHEIGLAVMGLALLDNPNVEVLRDACARHGRSEFLLVVAPLRIPGATSSAVNPLAVF
ncbi:MAG TPA: cyclase family protein [Acidimicrobiales bacterium]|nr:cyclase family protein [Acidimicrobiales bacterium]